MPATSHLAATEIDPLLYDFPLPHSRVVYPMGYPVEIVTNSLEIVTAAEEAWGQFARRHETAPVKISLAVASSGKQASTGVPSFRGQGHLVVCSLGSDDYVVADLARGFIFGWLTPATVSDRDWFRYHVLEGLVYMTLAALYCTPVHAACVALEGRALLLCGNSGAGKTSLAYACARRGWTYLADDATYLPRNSEEILAVGRPHHVRFRSSAVALFPELTAFAPVRRPNGKPDIEPGSRELGLTIAHEAHVAALVFLNRSPILTPGVEGVSKDFAMEHLEHVIRYGDENVRREQREHLRRVVRLPTFEVRYSKFDEADQLLRSLLDRI